jgi:hypothetical protein
MASSDITELREEIRGFRRDLAETREQIAAFMGTWGERVKMLDRVHSTVYGNGWPGLKARVTALTLVVSAALSVACGIIVWKCTAGAPLP